MDFFNSLTLDLKFLAVAIAGFALLALFSGNRKSEKRYIVVLALLAAVGAYRFTHVMGESRPALSEGPNPPTNLVKAPDKHVPLVSTSAK